MIIQMLCDRSMIAVINVGTPASWGRIANELCGDVGPADGAESGRRVLGWFDAGKRNNGKN